MLARIMNLLQSHICHISISLVSVFGNAREDKNSVLLKSGNIPYPISISEEERGLVLSSTILQYFYKQKTLNILFGRCGFGASAGCERKSKHSTRSDYKAAVKIGCLEFSSVYTKCCLIIGFNLFVNIPLKIPIKIPATSPERIKIGR